MKISQKLIKLFSFVIISSFIISCDEGGDPDREEIDYTTTVNYAGDWHIIVLEEDGVTPAFGGDYYLWSTYNAASNDNNFWIDDHDTFFEVKTKVQAGDFNNLTFTGSVGAPELYLGDPITISNGRIFKGAGHSLGGHAVDSIYFEIQYPDDPAGAIYKCGGHKRTGFLEDEL